jgi:hypothetical protein
MQHESLVGRDVRTLSFDEIIADTARELAAKNITEDQAAQHLKAYREWFGVVLN